MANESTFAPRVCFARRIMTELAHAAANNAEPATTMAPAGEQSSQTERW
jgi:hypothetical protein